MIRSPSAELDGRMISVHARSEVDAERLALQFIRSPSATIELVETYTIPRRAA
jgi:hypothetical protein